MRPSTRYALTGMAANLVLGAVCVALFVALPFGLIPNAIASALVWLGGGHVIDRRHLSRLSAGDRAEELRRRADSGL